MKQKYTKKRLPTQWRSQKKLVNGKYSYLVFELHLLIFYLNCRLADRARALKEKREAAQRQKAEELNWKRWR